METVSSKEEVVDSTVYYRLSRLILAMKLKYQLDQTQMTKFLNIPLADYLDMELGESSVPLFNYNAAINKFNSITPNDIECLKKVYLYK